MLHQTSYSLFVITLAFHLFTGPSFMGNGAKLLTVFSTVQSSLVPCMNFAAEKLQYSSCQHSADLLKFNAMDNTNAGVCIEVKIM